jgi:choline kinase
MTTRVLILAAGEATRWQNHRGTPKHRLIIEDEVLIERTARQFLKYTNDVVTVVQKNAHQVEGCSMYVPGQGRNLKDMAKFMSSQTIWSDDRTVLVFGDVYFTDEAVETIMSDTKQWRFYLRKQASEITGKPWREIFGISFDASFNKDMNTAILRVVSRNTASSAGGWHLLMELLRTEDRNKLFMTDDHININDWTEDFDFPKDLDTWEEKRVAWLKKQKKAKK